MNTQRFSELFEDLSTWQVFASGQAKGKLTHIEADDGTLGIRLDYDFHEGGGFVAVRRLLDFKLPSTFEIHFSIQGESPANHFEFKVASPGGSNVWRHLCQNFTPPTTWSEHRFHERDLPFAWGPAGGGAPSEIEAVEFVIAAGPGGKGFIEFAQPLCEDQTLKAYAAIHASSQQVGHPPESVFSTYLTANEPALQTTSWRAHENDTQPFWSIDFGKPLRFGGLVIKWPEAKSNRICTVEISHDSKTWESIYQADSAAGWLTHIPSPHAVAHHLRVRFEKADCATLQSIELRPDAFTHTPNEFIHSVAADYPRGYFPRYWLREQSYWTPIGNPEGRRRAMINEEGLVEVDEAGFSLEPFILHEDGVMTWAEAHATVSLPSDGSPMPSATWKNEDLQLEILPWIEGGNDNLTLHTTYRLTRHQALADIHLVVAIRPFQTNPPWQAFRNLGGRSPIHSLLCHERGIRVNGREVLCSPPADRQGAAAFQEGEAPSVLTRAHVPHSQAIEDPSGLASAEMSWALPIGLTILEVTVSVPYYQSAQSPIENTRAQALNRWQKTLSAVEWQVPACAKDAFACFRTAAGHILINRDGPAIQPGPRRYTRSWVRDCVIMGAALAKAGLPDSLHTFITWYASFQREDGFIPCVVDRDGIDWLVEHDSHGQFLWGVREVFRNSSDRDFLEKMQPYVRKTADFLIKLRAERLTDHYQSGPLANRFGLLPESASHEGYLAHPVHSYWDDFWGIRGLEAAADLATASHDLHDAQRWSDEALRFQADTLRSIDLVIAAKNLNYIPGSVEWADFDPTATSNAIAMLDFADVLPQAPLHAMLDTYLEGFHRKHRGDMQWNNYTAYEIRIIGAFVRLGKRETANELLDFFLSDRRPQAWNQWPEITWKNPRSPGHLGDVPHTWIAAEYMLALASMVVAERESSASLLLASGMPWSWITDENGFTVNHLPTSYGPLDFSIRADRERRIHLKIAGLQTFPPGGLSIVPPLPEGTIITEIVEESASLAKIDPNGTAIHISHTPFVAIICVTSEIA